MITETTPNNRVEAEKDPGWHWRNCRNIGINVGFFPLQWRFLIWRDGDVYGVDRSLAIGPLRITLHADIGNPGSENRFEAWCGLCEAEAYDRALRYEHRRSQNIRR
jgi:hypothetical protein